MDKDSQCKLILFYLKEHGSMHDIAKRIKSVINWQRWQILFPLLKDYWVR